MRLLKVKLVSGLPMDINPAHVESAFAIIDARAKVKKGDPAPEVVKVTMSSGIKWILTWHQRCLPRS